jgi:tetratricopeptide (TPR) repeat protein
MSNTDISEKVRAQFVGRHDARDAFYLRFAYRHMKNGIYYCGGGGVGKTWQLQSIIIDNLDDPVRVVTPIIDFFDTQNHSVHGLRAAIRSRLQVPDVFRAYDEALERLEEARSKPETHSSTIASLEARAGQVFIQCCQDAIVGREVILFFDTFERVQQRYVGQWMRQEFLPQVGDLIVAIAGRPEPTPAQMPDNVILHPLKGLSQKAYAELVRRRLPSVTAEIVESMWKHTGGNPLITHLILDLHEPQREQFIAQLSQLDEDERVQDSELQRWLVGQFVDPPDNRNKVVWAMAYLRRRFDVSMLKHIVENTSWFRADDYEVILSDLRQLVYVKEYLHQQSHLLHDEIQRMVVKYALPDVGIWEEFRADLYDSVVNRYYPKAIEAIEEFSPAKKSPANMDLARQLRAEQLGYILDQYPDAGLEKYESYRTEVEEKTHDYDFEELLWGEVREHLDRWKKKRSYDIFRERGRWLRRHSLFQKAEEHYQQMLDRFEDLRVEISQLVGFMAMRRGKIHRAKDIFEQSLEWVEEDDFRAIEVIESNLAQAAIEAGEWDKALEHYARSFRAATLAHDKSQMAAVYLSRGYLYSLKGKYSDAERQCKFALETLEPLPDNPDNARRTVYAWMNLGTVYRHTGDYAEAVSPYEKSLELARTIGHRETECDSLQYLGVNEHLRGRTFRRQGVNLTEACEHQLQAWQYLVDALEIARESGWRKAIASGLHRLAKVYREIYRLQQLPAGIATPDFVEALQTVQDKVTAFQMPFEIEFEHELLIPGSFVDLNWLEKAARLFQVSALIADEASDYHRSLDGLTELARLFLELEHFDLVPLIVRRIERIKGYDYEAELFTQISQIILGDWHFEQGRFDEALKQYETYHARLAKLVGYASYRLNDNLRNLEWRFSVLPRELVLPWCDALADAWLAQSVSAARPDMLDMLERIRIDFLSQSASSGSK